MRFGPDDVSTRKIAASDLSSCVGIFGEAFDDVHRAYGFDEHLVEADDVWLLEPLGHFMSTDPDRGLIVADADGDVAFGWSLARDSYRFLAFLFVRPRLQGLGLGRALLRQLLPAEDGVSCATMVESFHAVAIGLYAREGMLPRSTKHWLIAPLDRLRMSRVGDLRLETMSEVDLEEVCALDARILGFTRADDHRWWMRSMAGYVVRSGDRLLGYGYVDEGWIAPALAVDERTLIALFSELAHAVDGDQVETAILDTSRDLLKTLLEAGFRIGRSKYSSMYASSAGPLPASYVLHADWLP